MGEILIIIIFEIILKIVFQVIGSSVFTCSGKAPGYYADISSSCNSYLLCMGTSRSRGRLFSCPQGTKFQQRTLVCDHAHQVNCEDSEKYYKNSENSGKMNIIHTNLEQPSDLLNIVSESQRSKREKKIPSKIDKDTNKNGKSSKIIELN